MSDGSLWRLGVSTGCYYGIAVPTEDAVDRVSALGVDALELYVQGSAELEPLICRAIMDRVTASGLEVVSVHPYVYGWENLLFTSYERQQRWAWGHVRAYLDLCSATGADAYVSHGPPAHQVLADDGSLNSRYIAITRDLVALAADEGIHYCLENVSYGVARTPDDMRRHLAAVPDLRFVVDFKSAWKAGYAPVDFLSDDLLGSVHHTQVSFRDGRRHGCPASDEFSAAADPDIAQALTSQIVHVLEVEATCEADIKRSIRAIQQVGRTRVGDNSSAL